MAFPQSQQVTRHLDQRSDEQERIISPLRHAVALSLSRFGLELFLALSLVLPLIAIAFIHGVDAESALNWFSEPEFDISFLITGVLIMTLSVPLKLMLEAIALRAMGRVHAGVISRWSIVVCASLVKTANYSFGGQVAQRHVDVARLVEAGRNEDRAVGARSAPSLMSCPN